ncbi:hypothetical protein BHE90_009825 [Fusarium euwallaceae]|uniref:MalT-like TPR region domain-containing protein n=1 Tax=Fusarium euwallaceae TaxID=1147111 RepID=A0A430LIY6_9HYPO|nr:hypothetical protein BHE90_009825 [Fusarium euwallaceae]
MATFMETSFRRRGFTRVRVKEGQEHYSGKYSRKKERVEVLFLSCNPPTQLNASIKATAEILRHYCVPYRSAFVQLDIEESIKDIENPRVEARSQLQAWMESRQWESPRKLGRLLKLKRPSRFFIIVDETTSNMIKEIMLHHKSSLRENTVGLVFLQDNRPTLHQLKDDWFDTILLGSENDTFRERTWTIRINQYAYSPDWNCGRFIGSLEEPIRVAIRDFTDTGKPHEPIRATKSPHMQTMLYSDHLISQRGHLDVAPRCPSPQLHLIKGAHWMEARSSLSDWERKTQPLRLEDPVKVPGGPSVQKNLVTEAPALKAHTPSGDGVWEDEKQFRHLRAHAEACLSNSDLKHALVAFQRCLKMEIPWDSARWELIGSLALVRMGLGEYAKAEEELQKLLGKITITGLDDKGKKAVGHIQREIAFSHALALSRLERHDEVLACLSMIETSTGSGRLRIRTEEELILQGKISRLQALSRAYLGFQELQNLKYDLAEADHCCKALSDVPPPDGERHGRDNMFKDRSMEIPTILNKSRVFMLQGGYGRALEILQPALRDAITKMGETDVLTLEVTLLSCHLQILTGQVRRGRQSCERCADVIADTLGPEHNLALEAEYLLIAADQAEGLLTLALDDSLDLCHRAESRADFGPKHPTTLKYRSQLGGLHLERGNYLEAESILESAWTDSTDELSLKTHPNTLKIQSQLALARYHLGKLDMAERDIWTALRGQLRTYLRISDSNLWPEHDYDDEFFEKKPFVLDDIEDIYSPWSKLDDPMPHPDILTSLLTLGKILSRKQKSNLDLVLKIFWLVHVSAKEQLGPSHELSLAASLALGEVFAGRARMESDDTQQQKYYLKAASYYNFVVCPESSIHGPDSLPDTWKEGYEVAEDSPIMQELEGYRPMVLHARQEYLVVSLLVFDHVGDDINYVQGCKKELEFIHTAQQSLLGWSHPHRLKTLLSLLALQVGLDEPAEEVLKTQQELMGRLRRDDVRGQRELECLLMEENVVGVLCSRFDLQEGGRVIAKDIRVPVADRNALDPSLRDAVERIKDRTEAMLHGVLVI